MNSRRQSGSGGPPNLIRGRFTGRRLPEVEAFTASLPFDRRLYRHDIRGSIAHARMLNRVGLLSRSETRGIERGLREIEAEIDAGRFVFDLADEDIHLAIERRLTDKIGAAGAKLHAGRSRNDQVALDLRLFLADELREVGALLRHLRGVLVAVADLHVETVMPGYTHLQRAQPVSLAHHLLAYVEMVLRDEQRFAQALERTEVMPLGAGALAASTLPLNRRMVARELGLRRVTANSIDAVSDRDFAVDFLAAAALCAIHLSRMCEDLILWASGEFGFITLPDEFSTGSSMMPQKKNPDFLELVRGKSGRIVGNLVSLLVTLKGLPLAYDSDLQEDKERIFDSLDAIKPALGLMAELWPRLTFDVARMTAAAGGAALATDLAERLVQEGVPFRQAHEVVGALVRSTAAAGKELSDLSEAELRHHVGDHAKTLRKSLSAGASIAARKVEGGPAPGAVRKRLAELKRL